MIAVRVAPGCYIGDMATAAEKCDREIKIRLPSALHEDMRRVAADSDRSTAAEIRRALKQHVARHQQEGAAPR
jgi:hypothetical protein